MSDKKSRKMGGKFGVAIALAIVATTATTTTTARAEGQARLTLDWDRALVDIDRFARTGADRPVAHTGFVQNPHNDPHTNQPYVGNPGNAWFGVAPTVGLVARDWGDAYKLAGDRMSIVDAMRLSRSTRMVMTRVRLSNTRFTPFAQLGLGQWRVDTNILPFTPRSMEIAGQIGGGFEMRLAKGWQLACESTVTAIYREEREVNDMPQTRMWSAMIATHATF